ncbi:MAG: LysR substrate-binding domain-containing protein [Gammaproteobacteria bacterium]|nr:LysR substrate-binding domain-containing protein [Gammaproteobacteria bacterium]
MNIRDLKYLAALAEHCHFGQAASACHVTQPALSIQIKKLEASLGVQLIERSNKSVWLTETGSMIANHARDILDKVEQMRHVARDCADPFSGECRLGIIPTLAPWILPYIMPALTHALPQVTLYLVEEQTEILINKLKAGQLDAALLALPISENGLETSSLFKEPFLLAVPANHILAKSKKIKLSDLKKQTLLLLQDGHCLRYQALAVCQHARATEMQSFRATSLETLRYMVAAGSGITLMPKLACRPDKNIRYLPFADPVPMRTIGFVTRASTAKKLLLEKMRNEISQCQNLSF